jgi:hypothetical protein
MKSSTPLAHRWAATTISGLENWRQASLRKVAMTFEEASRWIASQERRIERLETALRNFTVYAKSFAVISKDFRKLIDAADSALETTVCGAVGHQTHGTCPKCGNMLLPDGYSLS